MAGAKTTAWSSPTALALILPSVVEMRPSELIYPNHSWRSVRLTGASERNLSVMPYMCGTEQIVLGRFGLCCCGRCVGGQLHGVGLASQAGSGGKGIAVAEFTDRTRGQRWTQRLLATVRLQPGMRYRPAYPTQVPRFFRGSILCRERGPLRSGVGGLGGCRLANGASFHR
jgi:hypothetical protein